MLMCLLTHQGAKSLKGIKRVNNQSAFSISFRKGNLRKEIPVIPPMKVTRNKSMGVTMILKRMVTSQTNTG